ncbi:MAG: hypothetical protein ACTSPB_21665, partial [Candidatus Thorarchaeota archaeon]
DLASRLGGEVKTTATTGGTVAVSVNGKSKEVAINSEDIEQKFTGSAAAGAIKTSKVPYLLDTKIAWNGSTYDVHEEIYLSGLDQIERDPSDTISNGTAYIQIDGDGTSTGSDVCYRYVFDTSTTAPSEPSLDKPLTITIMGDKVLQIVDWGSNEVSVLAGYKGTFTLDTLSQQLGPYTVSVNAWGDSDRNSTYYKIEKDGVSIVTDDALNADSGVKSYVLGDETVKIQVLKQRKGVDTEGNAYWEQDIIVGNETSQDLTSLNDGYFSGDSENGGYKYVVSTAASNKITSGDYIGVCPDFPTDNRRYLKYGEILDFANGYFQIGFPSWSTPTSGFKTVTIEKADTVDVYANASDTHFKIADNKPAIHINGGELEIGDGEVYSELWIVLNSSTANVHGGNRQKIWVAAKDSTTSRLYNVTTLRTLLANETDSTKPNLINITNDDITLKLIYDVVNQSSMANQSVIYINGTYDQLNFTVELNQSNGRTDFVNASGLILQGTNINVDKYDNADNGAGNGPIGDGGLIVDKPFSNFDSEKVVLKVPPEQLKAYVAFGKDISVSATGATVTSVTPIKTALGKLDTEITETDKSTKNLILVGGPCANSLVKDLLNAAWNVSDSCAAWLDSDGDHYIPAGQAMIKLIDDAFATGKAALIVAGTNAADTRAACSVLQQYDEEQYALSGTEMRISKVGESTTVTEVA